MHQVQTLPKDINEFTRHFLTRIDHGETSESICRSLSINLDHVDNFWHALLTEVGNYQCVKIDVMMSNEDIAKWRDKSVYGGFVIHGKNIYFENHETATMFVLEHG